MADNEHHHHPLTPQTRKTRIVCISDTHNQTPKLPKGDVLIHAGDLTNQGSYSELKKTVEWIEKADFEAKIVVAGNHDITLDGDFYASHGSSWRWPVQQDPTECRKLLTESSSITYLENQAATVCLSGAHGPHTCFKVFGSPCTPKRWNWAFQYQYADADADADAAEGEGNEGPRDEATRLWDKIPLDTDIVVTHTPPKGHGDKATAEDGRSGCAALLKALYRVRPMLSISGHLHAGRGVDRVRWNNNDEGIADADADSGFGGCCLEEDTEVWTDPGLGNRKQSIVDLTFKGGRPLDNSSVLTRQIDSLGQMARGGGDQPDARGALNSTSWAGSSSGAGGGSGAPLGDGAADSEAMSRAILLGGVTGLGINRQAALYHTRSDIGFAGVPDVDGRERAKVRRETVMVNAALMGPHGSSGAKQLNKPIVVDVDLPVWTGK